MFATKLKAIITVLVLFNIIVSFVVLRIAFDVSRRGRTNEIISSKNEFESSDSESASTFDELLLDQKKIEDALGVADPSCFLLLDLPAGIKSIPFSESDTLHMVSCEGGAYNGRFEFYMSRREMDGENETIRHWPLIISDKDSKGADILTASLYGNPQIDEKNNEMTVYFKSMGTGLCGTYKTYKIFQDKIIVTKIQEKYECTEPHIEPQDYPVIYENNSL